MYIKCIFKEHVVHMQVTTLTISTQPLAHFCPSLYEVVAHGIEDSQSVGFHWVFFAMS